MKKKCFVILTWFHIVFIGFAFFMYFAQNYLYNAQMAEGIARFYARSFFIPNVLGIIVFYFIYTTCLSRIFKGKNKQGIKIKKNHPFTRWF